LSDECRAWERENTGRVYQRKNQQLGNFNAALAALVGDLLRAKRAASLEESAATGRIYRSLTARGFTGESIAYRPFLAALRALEALGYVEHLTGKGRFTAPFDGKMQLKGTAARLIATNKLLTTAEAHGVNLARIHDHFRSELPEYPIAVTGASVWSWRGKVKGDPPAWERTPETDAIAAKVRKLNEFLALHHRIEGGEHLFFKRIFTLNLKSHGRLYSVGISSYQNLSPEERAQMRIDGEPTAEIDVGASHLTVFHAQLGASFDTTLDPYSRVEGYSRPVVKAFINISITKGKLLTKWPKKTVAKLAADHGIDLNCFPPRAIKRAVLAAYPALQRVGEPGVNWRDLLFIESEAVMDTLDSLMGYDVPALPVHDSIIVRLNDIEIATETFFDCYLKRVGLPPRLKTDSPLPLAQERVADAWEAKMGISEYLL
jgi:hypothetical protein